MEECGLSGYNLDKAQCIEILKKQKNEELIGEIKADGIGATFHD